MCVYCICMCVYVCMFVCVCLCERVRMHVCACVCSIHSLIRNRPYTIIHKFITTLHLISTHLLADFINPVSDSEAWQTSHLKQSGCQLPFMALMTRPVINSSTFSNISISQFVAQEITIN